MNKQQLSKGKDAIVLCWLLITTILASYGYLEPRHIETALDLSQIREALELQLNSSFHLLQKGYSYIVSKVNSYYCLQNGTTGHLDDYSTNATYIVESASGNLTTGRNHREKILLKGILTINHSIIIPSHTELVIDGLLIADSGLANNPILKGQGDAYGEDDATYDIVIQDARIDGDSVTGVTGILLNWTWRTTIRGMDIRNCQDGIYVYQSEQERIENCKIGGNSRYGIYFDGSGGASEIIGCEIHASGAEGIYLHDDVGDVKIMECDFYGNNRHIHLYSSRTALIESNTFTTGTINHVTVFNTNHSIIKSNIFKNVASGYYIIRIDNSFKTTFTENMMFDTRSPNLQKGILEENSSDWNQFKNNIIEATTPRITINGTNTTVEGNIGFTTENSGSSEASNDDYIAHGLAGEPTYVDLTIEETDANYFLQLKATNVTHFQIYLYDDTASEAETVDKTINWIAIYEP